MALTAGNSVIKDAPGLAGGGARVHERIESEDGSAIRFLAGMVLAVRELAEFGRGYGDTIDPREMGPALDFLASHKLSNVEWDYWYSSYRNEPMPTAIKALAAALLTQEGFRSFEVAFPNL